MLKPFWRNALQPTFNDPIPKQVASTDLKRRRAWAPTLLTSQACSDTSGQPMKMTAGHANGVGPNMLKRLKYVEIILFSKNICPEILQMGIAWNTVTPLDVWNVAIQALSRHVHFYI